MRAGIRTKLFLVSFGVICASVVVAYAYLRKELEQGLTEHIRADLTVRAHLVALRAEALAADPGDLEAWDALADELGRRTQARVSLVRGDGMVIGDSDVPAERLASVENHGGRSEIEPALRGMPGASTRRSATVDQRMLYVAVPFSRDGTVLGAARVALPLTEVDAAISRLHDGVLVAFVLALAAAMVLSTLAAQLASRPARSLTGAARRMAAGDLETRTRIAGHDEFAELGRALDRLAESLSTTLGELRAERDRMSGILSGMQEGVLLVDRERRVALVNPALREMLLLGADLVGRSPLEVIRHSEIVELLERAERGTEATFGELEVGGLKPRRLLVHAVPIPGETGGLLAVFVDVTHLRRLETLRRDFVANASHELRTPIAAIQSAAETLKEAAAKDPEGAQHFLDMIARNARRLSALVSDLLDLSRIESQELRLRPEPVPVASTVHSILELFRDAAGKKHIAFACDFSPEGLELVADRSAVEHVVTNLVDNAIKYCGPGSRVVLRGRRGDGFVELSVEDDGPGIAEEHLPRLFERFYRVDAGRSRELGGTGLGLAIVKHLVDAMNGTVRVESAPGAGTRFYVTLPVIPEEQVA